MPLIHRNVTVGTAAVEIVGADNMPHEVHLHNNNVDSAHILFLGNADVTTSNGFHLDGQQTITLNLRPDDRLYAVSNHNSTVVGVLDIRKND